VDDNPVNHLHHSYISFSKEEKLLLSSAQRSRAMSSTSAAAADINSFWDTIQYISVITKREWFRAAIPYMLIVGWINFHTWGVTISVVPFAIDHATKLAYIKSLYNSGSSLPSDYETEISYATAQNLSYALQVSSYYCCALTVGVYIHTCFMFFRVRWPANGPRETNLTYCSRRFVNHHFYANSDFLPFLRCIPSGRLLLSSLATSRQCLYAYRCCHL
jgi:hypothetical protein